MCAASSRPAWGARDVRITSIGGGPGGLYAAILLAKADPAHQITVYERNAASDTFGWGVVFSAATLSELEEADADSYDRMEAAFARWDPVDVRHRGQRIRARGNRFAAISRKRLLQILQQRCSELGVDVRFSTEVPDPRVHLDDADLVLGADGLNSGCRQAFAEHLSPRLVREGGKFVWFGTTLPLDAFTFMFAQTPAGRFQVHSYPFDEELSTFIVECDEQSWRNAGLDATADVDFLPGDNDEHAIAFCEDLFADELQGHPLLGNNSRWLDWYTVSNRTWRYRNLVLLGDAAHTAHFSIGSGTKLAMEDAIALAREVGLRDDLDTALAAYESDRRPMVDRVQEAARESLAWFDRYDRYLGFALPQFAYSLLTRSTRVTYENLKRRDRELVHGFDQWFAGRAGVAVGGAPLLAPPPPAFTPFSADGLAVDNRVVVAPQGEVASADGLPAPESLDVVADLGRGGGGLLLVEGVAVTADARITPQTPGLYEPRHAEAWTALVKALHAETTTRVGVQLLHAGARGATQPRRRGTDRPLRGGAWPLVAPSALPYTPTAAVPAALDREGMERIREAFAAAAGLADTAGFDIVEVHLARGYLLGAFLSPLTNRREDAFGGDLSRRASFPLQVVAAVREALSEHVTLSVCLSASDLQPGGITAEDVVALAGQLRAAGVTLFNVVAGQTTPAYRPSYDTGFHGRWSELVRNRAGVPTIASGNLPTTSEISHVVAAGQADLCILGRPMPTTPSWAHDTERDR
jgi:anthraniloyl-CoA monooxygenase